jgi:hypothetical protein
MAFFGCFLVLYISNLIKGVPLAKYFVIRNFTWLVVMGIFWAVSKRWRGVVHVFVATTFIYLNGQNLFLNYSGWLTEDDLHSQAVNAFNILNLALFCQVALVNSNYMMSQYATFPAYLICGIL